MIEASSTPRRKLRKQPKRRKVETTGFLGLPNLVVPKEAKQRRKRNNPRLPVSTAQVKRVAASSRWISAAILALCLFCLILIGRESTFLLTSIPVEGNFAISESEIIAASGLAGRHIFSTDPEEAANKIGQVPGVISATVVLRWPNYVEIDVAEDSPVALWEQDGRKYWVTADNQLMPARSEPPSLLLIQSKASDEFEDLTFLPEDVLVGGLQLKALRPNIDKLTYQPGTGLSYKDGRGWTVHFGTGSDMEQKLVVYETLIENLVERGVTPSYVNMRNKEKPFYRIGFEWAGN